MADIQAENGFTKIAHELLESIQMFKFSANELKIIMAVWRFTYGFNRKSHEMSLTFFMNHTGLSRSRVNDSIKKLMANNVLFITKKGNTKTPNIYSFNKDYDTWKVEKYSLFTSTKPDTSVRNGTSTKPDTSTSVQNGTTPSVRNGTQEIYIKDNLKKEEEEENPVKVFEQNFGPMSTLQMERIWIWVDDFDGKSEVVCLAIKETALTNPRVPFKYLEKILVDWHKRKLFTVDDVLREKQKFEKEKVVSISNNKKISDEDWSAL